MPGSSGSPDAQPTGHEGVASDAFKQLMARADSATLPLIEEVLASHEANGNDRVTALLDILGSRPETVEEWTDRLRRRVRELQQAREHYASGPESSGRHECIEGD